MVYDEVMADTPEHIVGEATELARSGGANAVIGFGGGSSLDVAKLVSLLANSTEQLHDTYSRAPSRCRRRSITGKDAHGRRDKTKPALGQPTQGLSMSRTRWASMRLRWLER